MKLKIQTCHKDNIRADSNLVVRVRCSVSDQVFSIRINSLGLVWTGPNQVIKSWENLMLFEVITARMS